MWKCIPWWQPSGSSVLSFFRKSSSFPFHPQVQKTFSRSDNGQSRVSLWFPLKFNPNRGPRPFSPGSPKLRGSRNCRRRENFLAGASGMRHGMNPGFGLLKGSHQLDAFLGGAFHFSFPANQQVIMEILRGSLVKLRLFGGMRMRDRSAGPVRGKQHIDTREIVRNVAHRPQECDIQPGPDGGFSKLRKGDCQPVERALAA